MKAADIYRSWATRQWWCRTKLAKRTDIPAFLTNGSALIITSINNISGYNGRFGPHLEQLPAYVEAYRIKAGLNHMVVVPYGWERDGIWAGIDYWPPQPSAEAWNTTVQAMQMQVSKMMVIGGWCWMVNDWWLVLDG